MSITCPCQVHVTKNETPFSSFLTAPTFKSVHGLGRDKICAGLTLTFFQRHPTHGQLCTLCAFVICIQLIRAVMLILDHSIFLRDFFTPAFQCPHQVERVGTLGDGGKWVCGLDRVAKQKHCVIYSSTPSVCLYFTLSMRPEWLARMHANPALYII